MKALYPWILEFVELQASPEQLRHALSAAGITVDSVDDSPAGPRFEVDLTTNRPDCLGHYGLAREVAAAFRAPLKRIHPKLNEARERAEATTRVHIEAPELCARFTARVIRGVQVGPSPDWLRQRLEALGQASINNIVDATNYVMFELGHPLHAFDLDRLAEGRIVVRRARPGERIITLDGIERTLTPEMLVVADAERPQGIAGVMGGVASEIALETKQVLLECAWFDPVSIRRTARALGLRTEASTRFERGMDPELAELASRRCAELIQQLAGGEILAGLVDAYPRPPERQKLLLTRRELLRIMGADVPDHEIEAILSALGFAPVRVDETRGRTGSLMAAWECVRPTWRHDVTREVDLIEEVARHYGYDRFPARMPPARQPARPRPHAEALAELRTTLLALGYDEIIASPLVHPDRDALFAPAQYQPVLIANPLSAETSQMRRSGIVSLVDVLEWNLNHGQRNLRLFEFGRRYALRDGRPLETPVLTLGATGLARRKSVHESERAFSIADLKGDLEALAERVGGFLWEPGAPEWLAAERSARLLCATGDGLREIGLAGALDRRLTTRLKLRQEVFVAELLLEPLCAAYEAHRAALRFRELPRFPAVERDLSLLLDQDVRFTQVRDTIGALDLPELVRIEALDRFRGGTIPPDKYSLLVRLTFQSPRATLTDAQVNEFVARVVEALRERLGATLRAG
jgi:phenylalanyl-tRNA synthetase beta chain